MQQSLIFALRCYRRVVSPMLMALFGPSARCRFEPSCSQYAVEAVRVHGAVKGSLLAIWRLCRCHPWGGCGVDPVPARKSQISDFKFKICPERETQISNPKSQIHPTHKSQVSNLKFQIRPTKQFQISNLKFQIHKDSCPCGSHHGAKG